MDQPSHGVFQDTDSPATTGRFRPYASTKHRVTRGRYITSNDRRGYIPVYEYPLNGQWIMMDIDDGYILWTGIWKALGNAKADIVKMLESQPDLAPQLRRVRGGYLKIQGTWMPYEVALRLARRVAWTIREDLIPLFGPTFPATCLAPDQPGYGQILGNQPGKRRGRRAAVPLPLAASLTTPQPSDSDRTPGDGGQQTRQPGASSLPPLSAVAAEEQQRRLLSPSQIAGPSSVRYDEPRDEARYSREMSTTVRYPHPGSHLSGYGATGHSPFSLASQTSYRTYIHAVSDGSHHFGAATGAVRDSPADAVLHNVRDRFSPYQNAAHSRHRSGMVSGSAHRRPSPVDLPPLTIPSSQPRSGLIGGNGMNTRNSVLSQVNSAPHTSMTQSRVDTGELITLPPINVHSSGDLALHTPRRRSQGSSGYSLPPISALSNLPLPHSGGEAGRFDSAAVLRRLAVDDDEIEGSQRSSFASAGDAERSHRDLHDDMIDAPTQEQLSRRRRSLSEPLLQSRDMSLKRPASGLGAPESRTKPAYDVSTRVVRGNSVTTPTSANHRGVGYSSASSTLARSRPSPRYQYGDVPTYSQAEEDNHLLSTVRTQHPAGQNHALTGQSRKQSMGGEKECTSPVRPSERPAHPPYSQSGVSDMHPTRHTFVESSYRLESDSPHSLEEPSSAGYQESQRYSIDKLPASNLHFSPPKS